jgi:parallel beta-helix repeat protein
VRKTVFGIMLLIVVSVGMLTMALNVQRVKAASGTIYIMPDGSISPSTANITTHDNVTYTFTGDMSYPTYYGIVVERNNIIINGNGYTVQGNKGGNGISLTGISNVTIKNINIEDFEEGIYLSGSNNNIISGNNATADGIGICLDNSSNNNTVSGNDAAADTEGIALFSSSNNNTVSGNDAAANTDGIALDSSSNNTVCGNTATANVTGIFLASYGIVLLFSSSSNKIYHNNFVIIGFAQAYADGTSLGNAWDNGYPSGGNYWVDYKGTDLYRGPYQNITGSDGIDDTPYVINSNNTDRYPLMAPYKTFYAGTWNEAAYGVSVVSNSTLSDFTLNPAEKLIGFNVTGAPSTRGFCRVTIPNALLGGPYMVQVNGSSVIFTWISDGANTYLYFNYSHSAERVKITGTTAIPEFPPNAFLPLFIGVFALAALSAKRKRPRARAIAAVSSFLSASKLSTVSKMEPYADINSDGKVNMLDIAFAARNFGGKDC